MYDIDALIKTNDASKINDALNKLRAAMDQFSDLKHSVVKCPKAVGVDSEVESESNTAYKYKYVLELKDLYKAIFTSRDRLRSNKKWIVIEAADDDDVNKLNDCFVLFPSSVRKKGGWVEGVLQHHDNLLLHSDPHFEGLLRSIRQKDFGCNNNKHVVIQLSSGAKVRVEALSAKFDYGRTHRQIRRHPYKNVLGVTFGKNYVIKSQVKLRFPKLRQGDFRDGFEGLGKNLLVAGDMSPSSASTTSSGADILKKKIVANSQQILNALFSNRSLCHGLSPNTACSMKVNNQEMILSDGDAEVLSYALKYVQQNIRSTSTFNSVSKNVGRPVKVLRPVKVFTSGVKRKRDLPVSVSDAEASSILMQMRFSNNTSSKKKQRSEG